MEVKIRTLTPIWTGDVDRKCSRIKETGIIGSLRWWYEALIRGFGGYACDPTSDKRCELKQEDEQLCPACQIFGCTGRSRRFRLEIEESEMQIKKLFFVTSLPSNQWWLDKIWEEQNEVPYGRMYMKIVASESIKNILLAVVWLISKYGGLGSKPHMGFGQILIENIIDEKQIKEGFKEMREKIEEENKNNLNWYNLNNFFILKFKIYENNSIIRYYLNKPIFVKTAKFPNDWGREYIPCSFDIKYHGLDKVKNKEFGLRHYFKRYYFKRFADKLFGYSRAQERLGGRIFISHLYKENSQKDYYYLKIWGFLPASLNNNQIENIKDEIRSHIEKIFEQLSIVIEKTGEEILEGLK